MDDFGMFVLLLMVVGVWIKDEDFGKMFWWWIICLICIECDIDGWWFE